MKNELNQLEIGVIERSYSLTVQSAVPFKGGMMSDVYLLTANEGFFVIKEYPEDFDVNLAKCHADISTFLRVSGALPAPEVYFNIYDEVVTYFGKRYFILMDYMPGKTSTPDTDNIVSLFFSSIAKGALGLGKYIVPNVLCLPKFSIPFSEQIETFENKLKENGGKIRKEVSSYWSRVKEIQSLNQKSLSSVNCGRQLVFGDLNLGNLLVEKGVVSGVIDFDQIHYFGKGFDFMHAFDNLCIDKKTPGLSLEERVDWNKLKEAISVYASIDPSISQEVESFPLMHQTLGLRNVIEICNSEAIGSLPEGMFEELFNFFVTRVEAPTQLGDRLVETLYQGIKEAGL